MECEVTQNIFMFFTFIKINFSKSKNNRFLYIETFQFIIIFQFNIAKHLAKFIKLQQLHW